MTTNFSVAAGMSLPRIYADFNGTSPSPRRPERLAVALDTSGSLRALANAGLELRDGLALIIWDSSDETEDLEADTTVYYHAEHRVWYAEMDEKGYRYVPALTRPQAP